MTQGTSSRARNEIAHGRKLALSHPETIWGWGTPAGSIRAGRRAELIAKGARLGTQTRALEIGCGTGLFTELLSKTGATLVAVDISRELLDAARLRGLPPQRVHFLEKRFEDCDVDGPFDAVVGSSVLHHLDIDVALEKIFRLLKPGGYFSFAEPNMLNPQVFMMKNVPLIREWLGDSPDETAFIRWQISRRIKNVGFIDAQVTPFDWLHPATPTRLIGTIQHAGRLLERTPFARELAGSLYIAARRPVL